MFYYDSHDHEKKFERGDLKLLEQKVHQNGFEIVHYGFAIS